MMKLCIRYLLFFSFYLFAACSQRNSVKNDLIDEDAVMEEAPLSEDIMKQIMPSVNYINWVRNPQNGLVKIKIIDELKYMVQYKPYEYIVCMEEGNDQVPDTLMKQKVEKMQGMQYYDLKILLKNNEGEILKAGLNSRAEYDNRVKYFSFGMQNDIMLVDGSDTLSCMMYHFERAYDVTPVCTILLGFTRQPANAMKSKTLLVYDKTFNKGLLKFTFREKRLQTLPKLLTL